MSTNFNNFGTNISGTTAFLCIPVTSSYTKSHKCRPVCSNGI